MASLNQCNFIGNLGKDPELLYTASGIAVAKFSIACGESWKDSDGNKQERTEWVNIVAWKKLAEICGQYLKKGSKVFVSGRFTTRSWDDKNTGVKRYSTEIVADKMVMLDSKGSNSRSDDNSGQPESESEPEAVDTSLPF